MTPGSIEDTVARLLVWSKRAPKGFARVEFDSEHARQQAVVRLQAALAETGIPLREIDLPHNLSPARLVATFIDRLDDISSGVVSVSGFAEAFAAEGSLTESLQVLNFNRENFARSSLRQIWWMPTAFAEKFIQAVPDLNSWFLVRLYLKTIISSSSPLAVEIRASDEIGISDVTVIASSLPEIIEITTPEAPMATLPDARTRAAHLVERFEHALAAGIPAAELRRDLAIPAVSTLLEAGAEQEARELALRLAEKIRQAKGFSPDGERRADFFISYTSVDGKWAEWIAYQLEQAGYSTVIQAWDFRPGTNFVLNMQDAASRCKRIICVLSPQYLSAKFTAAEWAAAFAIDPGGKNGALLPVRVAPCDLKGLLTAIVYIDLVGLDEETAKATLLQGVQGGRAKPFSPPKFPGHHAPKQSPPTEEPEFPGNFPSVWNVPYARNPFFVGREEELARLHKAFTPDGVAMRGQVQIISGLGGMGKTQIAVEYAYRYREHYSVVLWVKADSHESLLTDFVALAKVLDLPEKETQDQNVSFAAVQRWLQTTSDWLLIFDNADDPEALKGVLPAHPRGHVLLTSRAHVFDSLGVVVSLMLEKLLPDDARRFLFARTGRADISEDSAERMAVDELTYELDYLPLALEQAAAYIVAKHARVQDYLASYRKRGLEVLERTRSKLGDYSQSVATTWILNFEQVRQDSPASADLLRISAFFHPDAVPLELITGSASELGPLVAATLEAVTDDPLTLDEILEPLIRFSLIHRDLEAQTYGIHRLVQAVVKEAMDSGTQRLWAERTVRALARVFPNVLLSTWPTCERLLPHALECVDLIKEWQLTFPEVGYFLNRVGHYLYERAQYDRAESIYWCALKTLEKIHGPNHPEVAATLNNFAVLSIALGKYSQAQSFLQRALVIREQVLGPTHPDVATVLHNLARLYDGQGQYAESRLLYQRALAIREQELGPNHPAVATTLDNLAGIHHSLSQDAKALRFHQRALSIREQLLGTTHPSVAISLNNIAEIYRNEKRYAKAEPLYLRALTIQEKTLGENHPDVAATLNNLALLYANQGQYTMAESLLLRSLAIREQRLGLEHPDAAISLSNLAALYHLQRRYAEAASFYQRALRIQEHLLGPNHPNVAQSLRSLAALFHDQKQYSQAESFYLRALNIFEQSLGPDDSNVARVLGNYASMLRQMGRVAEAEPLEDRARTIHLKHESESSSSKNV